MKDFVAATLFSGPACSGSTTSHVEARGEDVSLTSATVSAPSSRPAWARLRMSGLRPDCETARKSAPRILGRASYTDVTDGPTEAVTRPEWISRRYLTKVAALSELPRAQVTAKGGGEARRR